MAKRKKDHESVEPESDGIEIDLNAQETGPLPDVEDSAPALPSSKRGMGWSKDPNDARDYSTKQLFGARRGSAPTDATLEGYVVGIRDQLSTSSCVGQALARAIHVRMAAAGSPIQYPSALAIYDVGRAMERTSKGAPLRDVGTQPRLAMRGIREWGVPLESDWPFDEAHVNAEPPLDVLEKGSAFKLANWYRIDASGGGRIEDVCQALAAKHPVILGVEVDDAFQNYSSGVLTAPVGTYGGHMLCLVGYRTVNGHKQFRGVNSWGTSWGDKGMFWTDESWLTDVGTSDLYTLVVTGV